MVKFLPSQPMGVKEHFAFINWVLISLNLGRHSGLKKMLVITDWFYIQSLGPCGLNMKLTQVDPFGVLKPQF
jgi:hypothetical protein